MRMACDLYAERMVDLKHLRALVAVVDEGTFTDAAARLGVSQAAVSRSVAALEKELGTRLLRRTSREVSLTADGQQVLARARRILTEVDDLVHFAGSARGRLRIGYAWAALGRHTAEFQRRWARQWPQTEARLVRHTSPTSGLAEGACELAVVRSEPEDKRFATAIVGLERRMCALSTADPLARRRSVRLAQLSDRTLLVDRRTGTTRPELWPAAIRPATAEVDDLDDWLILVAGGECIGVTSEATAHQYRRPGVVYRPVRDAEPIAVRLAWWRDDPHPATPAVIDLVSTLYRDG